MEEDIEILEKMLNRESSIYKRNKRGNKEIKFEVNSNYYKAIENLLTRYKQLEEENENLKNDLQHDGLAHKYLTLKATSIPKSKVKEKIEELDERIKNPERTSYWASYTVSECIGIRRILQDLLERSREDE